MVTVQCRAQPMKIRKALAAKHAWDAAAGRTVSYRAGSSAGC